MAVPGARSAPDVAQDRLVSQVDPIEGPHGDDGVPDVPGEPTHATNTFFG